MKDLNIHDSIRSHNFDIVIYEDTTDYDYFEVLRKVLACESFAYIKHDKDLSSDNTLKKVHYHIILHFSNCRTINSISNYLGVPSNYINSIKSLKGAIRYLVHRDNDDKFQYNINDISYSENFTEKINYAFTNEKTQHDILITILNYIDSCKFISLNDLFRWCLDNNYELIYKKYYYVLKDLVSKKN